MRTAVPKTFVIHVFNRRKILLVPSLVLLAGIAVTLSATRSGAAKQRHHSALQFDAGGHALKFEQQDVLIGARDHGFKIEFVDSHAANVLSYPRTGGLSAASNRSLGKVRYEELWNGISADFEPTTSGILKSTYLVAPHAKPDQVSFRYNVAAEIDKSGALVFHFPNGTMRESAPIAWQTKDEQRVPVPVRFERRPHEAIGFAVTQYDASLPLIIDPTLQWNTFMGGNNNDFGLGIATDSNGNVYVVGQSDESWGSPIRAHSPVGGPDAFVAKLDANGALLWNTFLGGGSIDAANAVAVDSNNNIYVTGFSNAAWGSPLASYNSADDVFVAKLDTNGALQWHTFFGSSASDRGNSIAVDGTNIYIAGFSEASWGTPVSPFTAGLRDAFAAKLTTSGGLVWNAFMGSTANDFGNAVAVDVDGNVYIAGQSNATWASPVRAYTARAEGFAAKLNSNGQRQWNTFFGNSNTDDEAHAIAVDGDANVYVTGISDFVAKLNSAGVAQWNVPTGGVEGTGLAVDNSGNVFVTGETAVDAITTKFDTSGAVQWQTFSGGTGTDVAKAIAIKASGTIYVTGHSDASWGAPVRPYSSSPNPANDAFVFKLQDLPPPTVQFNSSIFSASEGPPPNGSTARVAQIVVTRSGDTSTTVSVDFSTTDGTALQRTDYTTASGTITFAPGQVSRTFNVLLVDDGYVEQTETVNLTLSNPSGATLGSPTQATVFIDDDEEAPANTSPLDDASYFVRQHYFDFLNRAPDSSGFNFWVSQITGPPACDDPACLTQRRITVSNAFFFELEFQQTGAYVFRLYRVAFGNNQPFSNPRPDPNYPNEEKKLPSYQVFSRDRAKVTGGSNLAQKQLDLANVFVNRPEFIAKYPPSLATADQFVDAILTTIQTDLGVNLSSERSGLMNLYNSGGRGAVLYRLADDNTQTNPINNRPLIDAEYNRAFVATQYFGYLRRNPDIAGIVFWLGQVNSAPLRDLGKQNAMVCSFITSGEYQLRFSPVAPHSNSECPH